MIKVLPGKPYPRGPQYDGNGTNFSLFSENAQQVDLLLFNSSSDTEPIQVVTLPVKTASTWHGYLPGIGPGQLYAYRVHGPYDPSRGHRFNPNKALIDPYAKALSGDLLWDNSLFGYRIDDPAEDLSFDERSSIPFIPKSIVIDPVFDWEGDRHVQVPWNETIIYETHLKALTMNHPDIPQELRGTYAGFGTEPIVKHLTNLGVTAVEFLPLQQHVNDRQLLEKGLSNYWGYNTIGFFAPDFRYAADRTPGAQVNEFKTMVKTLHRAGIEVILDVVYNHTAEGSHLGPSICFRGIDNASYYYLSHKDRRYYMDFSGCGGCFNMSHPRVLQFIMDSLRYWVIEMHVDGFRFDLAATLFRGFYASDRLSTFFDVISQDPILSQVKLIAEPWDLGPGGYQVGNFPELWTEWNGKYRDTIRRFWKGDDGQLSQLGYRLTGSSDLYKRSNRNPHASINFITCHDGFTLRDLVSYNGKYNKANGEDNRDGTNDNDSWNCGVEGESDDPEVIVLRKRQIKNMLASMLLSQGTPMLFGGDELGKTKSGNNNTYCQDNDLSWIQWDENSTYKDILAFTRFLIALRKKHPVLRRKSFFQGKKLAGRNVKDIHWFRPDGKEMSHTEWAHSYAKSIGMLLSGDAIPDLDKTGRRIVDDSFLLLFNAHWEAVPFKLPRPPRAPWVLLLDTSLETSYSPGNSTIRFSGYTLAARSFVLFSSSSSEVTQ